LFLSLGFRLNTSDEKAKHAYEKLYHYSADWRLGAVEQLLQNLKITKKRERSVKLLQECLPDRINDDSGAVVSAVLSLTTEELSDMLGPLPLAQTLCLANCPFERLHSESLLLLVCIYGKQQAAVPDFKRETVLNLVGQKWLIPALSSLAKGNIAIQSICMPLVTAAVTAVREQDHASNSCKLFLDNLLSEVPMATPIAQQLIK